MEKGEASAGVSLGTDHRHWVLTVGRAMPGLRTELRFLASRRWKQPASRGLGAAPLGAECFLGSVPRVVAWATGALGRGNR